MHTSTGTELARCCCGGGGSIEGCVGGSCALVERSAGCAWAALCPECCREYAARWSPGNPLLPLLCKMCSMTAATDVCASDLEGRKIDDS